MDSNAHFIAAMHAGYTEAATQLPDDEDELAKNKRKAI